MKNTDFNSVMDIQAVDVILNSDVELHIIPGNVSGKTQNFNCRIPFYGNFFGCGPLRVFGI